MKIALVSQEYPPETARGGIGSQTFSKAIGLSQRGHEVFVISRSKTNERTEIKENNLTVIRIPGLENIFPEMDDVAQWITNSTVVAKELINLVERSPIDLIDFPEWAAEGYVFQLSYLGKNRPVVVVQLHGPLVMLAHSIGWPEMNDPLFSTGTAMEATSVRLADAVYSSSKCSASWIQTHYDKERKQIPVIHLGIETAKLNLPRKKKQGSQTVLFVGKLVQNKGVEELVRAAIVLRSEFPELKLKLIGGGENQVTNKLKALVKENDAGSLVEFLGYAQSDQLVGYFRDADVFAAPSYYEGGPGFVYLEAMAAGLPVIGCSGSGIEEIIENEITGLLVPPRDQAALEQALRRVLQDREFANELGAKAKKYVETDCEREVCLDKLESFYKSVIEEYKSVNNSA